MPTEIQDMHSVEENDMMEVLLLVPSVWLIKYLNKEINK